MSEFIGSRISLISKSDIRYVGILHEINSEASTVALEQVQSFGTEGRKGNPEEEIPASDNIYEYIVFRGGDVKDLRIEEPPKKEENKPPSMPNDPAILGSARPAASNQSQSRPLTGPRQQPPQPRGPYPHHMNQYQQYQQRFGNGPTGPYAFPNAPPPGNFGPQYGYGGPPQGFPGHGPPPPFPPGPFPPQQHQPFGGPGSHRGPPSGPPMVSQQQPHQNQAQSAAQQAATQQKQSDQQTELVEKPTDSITAAAAAKAAPPPPVKSKPTLAQALAPPIAETAATKATAIAQRPARVVPAMPLANPAAKFAAKPAGSISSVATGSTAPEAASAYANSTEAATAAVAAAMAKLQPNAVKASSTPQTVDNLTQKVNDMRFDTQTRGRGGYRGRGGRRGGMGPSRPMEVPKDDFDFETANAKFNKQDLVKEAIGAVSPLGSPNGDANNLDGVASAVNGGSMDVLVPAAPSTYNKSTSFFDNISSEAKEKEESAEKIRSNAEFRHEERKRNLETFGLGSVDGAYGRGGYRGRGRGRGYRGRGGHGRGRGRGDPIV